MINIFLFKGYSLANFAWSHKINATVNDRCFMGHELAAIKS
ncbi:hypothetical protein MTBBW1_2310009 [Desulfamplus magnetovallimortis]|uniref:Uncharacterized protein n=1 Tax=Desulfamplus magnetovallimortis TaxID=1246637 RepID=A0A1W1HDI6_9BACT|nr:hypothetical protein MTBBW1_2310009 [Desulfamplus magnetovallimortis]